MAIPELPVEGDLGLLLDIIQSHIMVFWGAVLVQHYFLMADNHRATLHSRQSQVLVGTLRYH